MDWPLQPAPSTERRLYRAETPVSIVHPAQEPARHSARHTAGARGRSQAGGGSWWPWAAHHSPWKLLAHIGISRTEALLRSPAELPGCLGRAPRGSELIGLGRGFGPAGDCNVHGSGPRASARGVCVSR